MRRSIRTLAAATTILAAVAMAGCSSTSSSSDGGSSAAAGSGGELRLGYFPNLTHAPALVGVDKGYYQDALNDSKTTLKTSTFNAGPDELQALLSNSIDAAFIGPSPTVTGWAQSKGAALNVIAGAAANGAGLVVGKDIKSVADLKGKTIASPQLGNTQDIALRYWLQQQGYKTTTSGGGDVSVTPTDNGTALTELRQGKIDGAWVPEPYLSEMVAAGGHVLVNEADTWTGEQFVVTNLVVSQSYLKEHPDQVSELLEGLLKSENFIDSNPDEAKTVVNAALKKLSGAALPAPVLDSAWKNVKFTYDPLASTLKEQAAHAESLDLLDSVDLSGLYDLDPLNALLKKQGKTSVAGL